MKYKERNGEIINPDDSQDKFLERLYTTVIGRMIVKILINPVISNIGGWFMNSPFSRPLIKSFIINNLIDMSQYEEREFVSYNDFFTRKIKENMRPIDMNKSHLISPCDSKLTVYDIGEDSVLNIKNTSYSIYSLLRDKRLVSKYQGGKALVFRLTVDDYHRYIYIDDGYKSHNRSIAGVYHTVNPIANDMYPIYRENHREYTMLRTDNFGDVIQMEVGALMVGRITNLHQKKKVIRGEEKGFFEFGGSTIVLLLEKDKASIDKDIIDNTKAGIETRVLCGQKIGTRGTYGKT
ncbi:MAG: phosphatidylserine decarboxylase [Lachnospiraceae bacterium]|nr:phosphatidylserine decarboxylase [Lachnospiraceae bacterium]